MHIITQENAADANAAIRDILFLFKELADGSAGFGHAVDHELRFDPLRFVDAEVDPTFGWRDIDLLRSGSAVAMLCHVYDWWLEESGLAGPHTAHIQQALDEGRLRRFPDIEAVLREAFRRGDIPIRDPWFDEAVVPVYRNHVLAYFRRLSTQDAARTWLPHIR